MDVASGKPWRLRLQLRELVIGLLHLPIGFLLLGTHLFPGNVGPQSSLLD